MVKRKVAAAYIRRYRDDLARQITRLATLKAVASGGGIAGWVIWKEYAFVWGTIIAVSQLANALKEVFPFTQNHKAASEHYLSQLEWENIFSGRFGSQNGLLCGGPGRGKRIFRGNTSCRIGCR
jgi:hypothetical protein